MRGGLIPNTNLDGQQSPNGHRFDNCMENRENQILKVNCSTDWNQSLVNLWNESHEADLKEELTVLDLNIFGQRNWRFRD